MHIENHKKKRKLKKVADKLSKILLKIEVRTGENGENLLGGVSSKEIAESLKEKYDIVVDKKKIELKETIKRNRRKKNRN